MLHEIRSDRVVEIPIVVIRYQTAITPVSMSSCRAGPIGSSSTSSSTQSVLSTEDSQLTYLCSTHYVRHSCMTCVVGFFNPDENVCAVVIY